MKNSFEVDEITFFNPQASVMTKSKIVIMPKIRINIWTKSVNDTAHIPPHNV